jgi:hypothetical protein
MTSKEILENVGKGDIELPIFVQRADGVMEPVRAVVRKKLVSKTNSKGKTFQAIVFQTN